MAAPKNYSVKGLLASSEPEVLELMRGRYAHLNEKKARRAARELVALRRFHARIAAAGAK